MCNCFIFLGGCVESSVVPYYKAPPVMYPGMTKSERTKAYRLRKKFIKSEQNRRRYLLKKEKLEQQRVAEIPPEKMESPVVPVKLTPVIHRQMTNSERSKAYKLRKKLERQERDRQYYQKNKEKLKQRRDAKKLPKKKVFPDEVKPWEELTRREKQAACARKRRANKKIMDLINEQKEREKKEKDRKRKQRQRLRDRLEQEYYMSKMEVGISQEDVLEEEEVDTGSQSFEVQKSDIEQDIGFVIVKREDSTESSETENDDSNLSQKLEVETSGPKSDRLPLDDSKNMKSGTVNLQTVKADSGKEDDEASDMESIIKQELLN